METGGLIARSLTALPGSTGAGNSSDSRLVGSLLSVNRRAGLRGKRQEAGGRLFCLFPFVLKRAQLKGSRGTAGWNKSPNCNSPPEESPRSGNPRKISAELRNFEVENRLLWTRTGIRSQGEFFGCCSPTPPGLSEWKELA